MSGGWYVGAEVWCRDGHRFRSCFRLSLGVLRAAWFPTSIILRPSLDPGTGVLCGAPPPRVGWWRGWRIPAVHGLCLLVSLWAAWPPRRMVGVGCLRFVSRPCCGRQAARPGQKLGQRPPLWLRHRWLGNCLELS